MCGEVKDILIVGGFKNFGVGFVGEGLNALLARYSHVRIKNVRVFRNQEIVTGKTKVYYLLPELLVLFYQLVSVRVHLVRSVLGNTRSQRLVSKRKPVVCLITTRFARVQLRIFTVYEVTRFSTNTSREIKRTL